jgi:peptidoglycan/LPS O-acetylase OafA/YrhL
MRAVAALSVVMAHEWLFGHNYLGRAFTGLGRFGSGLGFGVMLFFALSGYLLYRPFARRHFGGGGALSVLTYARNRALRILPLYWVTVIVLLLLTQHGGSANQWWRFMTFSESFSLSTAQQVDGPMWSLVVEVHFYVLLPLLAWGLARLRHPAAAAVVLIVLGGASAWFWHQHLSPAFEWQYSLPATFFGFVPGMVLALLQTSWTKRRSGILVQRDLWLAGGVGLWVVVCLWPVWEAPLVAGASFLALGAVVLPLEGGWFIRLLDLRPLALAGVASYSLYLWHVPIIEHVWAGHGLSISTGPLIWETLPVALVVAGLSYAVVERSALTLRGRWFGAGPSPPGGATPISTQRATSPPAKAAPTTQTPPQPAPA